MTDLLRELARELDAEYLKANCQEENAVTFERVLRESGLGALLEAGKREGHSDYCAMGRYDINDESRFASVGAHTKWEWDWRDGGNRNA